MKTILFYRGHVLSCHEHLKFLEVFCAYDMITFESEIKLSVSYRKEVALECGHVLLLY